MICLDIRVTTRNLFEHALPEIMAIGENVGFVAHRDLFAPLRARVLESRNDDALDAFSGIDLLLDGYLVVRPFLEVASHEDVHALGIFTKYNEIHIFSITPFERAKTLV